MDDLFSGIIPIIIIIAVINILRGVMKKRKAAEKQQQQQGEGGQSAQPARPVPRQTGMSEIQRAFMMMSGLDEEEKPKPKPQPKPYVHAEGFHGRVEGKGSHEGTHGGYSEGKGSHEGTRGLFAGEHSMPHEGMHKHEGQPSLEGTHGLDQRVAARIQTANQPMPAASPGKYTGVTVGKYFMDEDEDEKNLMNNSRKPRLGTLKLFENKDDYTKAVIYSEILTRRSARR